jgi:hypothetical protein
VSSVAAHPCGVCFLDFAVHPEQCEVIEGERHWPPLCCPGCPCGSFEEAHPGLTVDSVTGVNMTAKGDPAQAPVTETLGESR